MARLNEPPQPSGESIDALKRRFVRQNRELARVNSTQSIRIRNLESEVSRLLSENVSLREQIIKLRYEAEKSTELAAFDSVNTVKSELEAKLSELGALVQELGNVQKNVASQRKHRRRSISRNSPKRSPDQRNWKNALTLSEVTGGADGRLPPILEDKYFPRRTMDAEELLGMTADPANTTDSPDLGPPPVAHFDEGDPIKFDATQKLSPREGSAEITEEEQPRLSVNLETRKRRRESSHRLDMGVRNVSLDSNGYAASTATATPADQPLRSSAKRKLNVRDDDDQPVIVDDLGKQDSQLNCRGSERRVVNNGLTKSMLNETNKAAGGEKASEAGMPSTSGKDGKEKTSVAPATVTATGRKALGPKSVNTDPTSSPAKVSRLGKDKVTEAKEDLAKIARERNRPKDRNRPKNPGIARVKDVAIKDVEVKKPLEAPPETPAPPLPEVFSPGPSEPSAARHGSRDTPPPPDLGPDTGTGSFGRASRRPKGTVSYVQPNLRDKMRRPTKELVDAVGAEERARIAKAEGNVSKPVFIKQEEDADAIPAWKTNAPINNQTTTRPEPTSPLDNKIGASELPASVITERRRRTFVPAPNDDATADPAKPASGAASAIAALTAAAQRSKRREVEEEKEVVELVRDVDKEEEPQIRGEAMERTSIYDFTSSSPVVDPYPSGGGVKRTVIHDTGQGEEVELANNNNNKTSSISSRSSRRHSSVPTTTTEQQQGNKGGSIVISRRGGGGGGDRRRDTTVVARGEAAEGGQAVTRPTKGALNVSGGGSDEAASANAMGSRGERAANRRRSMMI